MAGFVSAMTKYSFLEAKVACPRCHFGVTVVSFLFFWNLWFIWFVWQLICRSVVLSFDDWMLRSCARERNYWKNFTHRRMVLSKIGTLNKYVWSTCSQKWVLKLVTSSQDVWENVFERLEWEKGSCPVLISEVWQWNAPEKKHRWQHISSTPRGFRHMRESGKRRSSLRPSMCRHCALPRIGAWQMIPIVRS